MHVIHSREGKVKEKPLFKLGKKITLNKTKEEKKGEE